MWYDVSRTNGDQENKQQQQRRHLNKHGGIWDSFVFVGVITRFKDEALLMQSNEVIGCANTLIMPRLRTGSTTTILTLKPNNLTPFK